jgi:hypothetical protein
MVVIRAPALDKSQRRQRGIVAQHGAELRERSFVGDSDQSRSALIEHSERTVSGNRPLGCGTGGGDEPGRPGLAPLLDHFIVVGLGRRGGGQHCKQAKDDRAHRPGVGPWVLRRG